MSKVKTFLMFEGKAEEAINFYTSLIENSEIISMSKYGPEGPGAEGSVMLAVFTLDGQKYMAIDSPNKHEFTFTPSISLFVTCKSEEEMNSLWQKLSEGGKQMMPLDNYGFSKKFGWTSDRFGVSWQLNLE